MTSFNDGGPAFPATEEGQTAFSGQPCTIYHPGMSLRDWFAGQAMQGMVAYSGSTGAGFGPGDIAARSYEIADAMLAEREKGK